MPKKTSQTDLIKQYYVDNPDRDINHPEVVDWVTNAWRNLTGKTLRDPDRAIRKLHEQGWLIKVKKGVYRLNLNPTLTELEDFPESIKKEILERDGYKCVICGRGKAEGMEVQVDHIKPKSKGGKATLENGQTLCSQHNFRKKNYEQTESGKKMFIRLLELAEKNNDQEMILFCKDILGIYDKHGVNGHIDWQG
jgi:hypothetical protein